ncbi:mechanosensitive ion channel [Maribacter polysiphoniae]|uniref:Mechanosensing system component YbdG n=1 Tax=Maribacter polysiphoniae TaxID=429344 RepID=A0A316DYD9_9FLAO|nr:mechanosensitive ion channel domain-containing protein [Maribacter polysiphoniae]MBD1261341.1 mechanosensitive ion channel [Maribacter polysiphoniae]PWK23417.1 miniconductance mechanosensitive channel [Maribacter polysiphoniae]
MKRISHWIFDFLVDHGLSDSWAGTINMLALLLLVFIVLFVVDFFLRKIIVGVFNRLSSSSKTHFDDLLVHNKVPRNIAHIIPLALAYKAIPAIFRDFPNAELFFVKAIEVCGIILFLWIVRSVLHTVKDFLKTLASLRDKPIDSYIQVFMIFAWAIGLFYAFSIVSGIELWKFLTALGTASAVIILIFKDTILGFVASIQVSINDMVRIGDWITFEKYGADGDVIEINLATVKVQNFDKTITTIPTYALISDSFKNWRGMDDSGGRRIKRALIIKQESIKFLTKENIEALKKIELIRNYLETRGKAINTFNSENGIDKSLLINGKNLTNVGVFRKYIDTYINRHSGINKEMTIMVRHLKPSPQGLPIEIYAFSSDKRWANYEYIMADIFDHLLAAIPYFELEGFELPSSTNFKK